MGKVLTQSLESISFNGYISQTLDLCHQKAVYSAKAVCYYVFDASKRIANDSEALDKVVKLAISIIQGVQAQYS